MKDVDFTGIALLYSPETSLMSLKGEETNIFTEILLATGSNSIQAKNDIK